MKRIISVLAAAVIILASCAENAENFHKTKYGFKTEAGLCLVEVQCYSPSIIRVIKTPIGTEMDLTPSFSIVKTPEKVRFSIERYQNEVSLSTSEIIVMLDLCTGEMEFLDSKGSPVTSEAKDSFKMSPRKDADKDSYSVTQGFNLEKEEAIYGLGQHRNAGLNQRGKSRLLRQENMEIAIPLVHSVKGYAIYWDNYAPTTFREEGNVMSFSSEVGDKCDYYFIKGDDADDVIDGIRQLSGTVPMNPLWAFGFHQSRERYTGQDELVGTLRRYRKLGIPLDGIIQDWQYWGDNEHWNAIEFLNPSFPDPKGMMEEIHSLNAKGIISIWPSFGPETDIFKEFAEKDMLLPMGSHPGGGTRVYDAYDPGARDIYWSWIKKNMVDIGMDGWWLDATEPEHNPILESDFDHMTHKGTFRSMRNGFPLYSVSAVYDNQRKLSDKKRVFILTRSASLGTQRQGAHCWSGDVIASWETLDDQIAEALNFTLTGLPYWNSDIGGFWTWQNYPDGNRDPKFIKLYNRWMQFATFCGMMRSHGTNTPREIFNFSGRDFDIQERFINLRYLLLPYIYSHSWKITSENASLMRALVMDYPEDKMTWNIDDEFIFGERMLIAPVTTPDDRREIYLPAGTWIDFWTGCRLSGGGKFEREVYEDQIPVYVKAGTIMPIGPTVQYSSEKPWNDLQIRIYTGEDGTFTLYEDEFDGYAYENDTYSTIRFSWDDEACELTVGPRKGRYPGMLKERDFRVVVARPDAGSGLDNESCDIKIHYIGKEVKIKLE